MEPNREKLLNFIRTNGPVLPVQVSKYINTDIIFAGAMLSELAANNHVIISNTKKGGSPFYYVKGQESKLQAASQFLPSKEKEAYELIREKRVLMDIDILPWQRVALRAIKDYAVPIEVEFEGNKELFWKWYLSGNEEVNSKVEEILSTLKQPPVQEAQAEEHIEADKTEEKPEIIAQKKLNEITDEREETKIELQKKEKPARKKRKEENSDFINIVSAYFQKLKISIIETSIVKTNKEVDYIVKIPSSIGDLFFYLKAKNKASISESDLALAYSSGQQKKLHTIFLSNGRLNKKGKEYLEKHLNGQVNFISLDGN
ncbi:MAG: hypothetical protein AABW41_04755 [Nanoarchaeota archaeon]